MPNIEMHGFTGNIVKYHKLKEVITQSELSFKKDIVITLIDSCCLDLDGKTQPFLRICDTDHKRTEKIVRVLEKLGYDIEVLLLKRFYPASS